MALQLCERIETKFGLTINEVKSLQSESYQFELRSIQWNFRVSKVIDENGDAITVDLERIISDQDARYNCIATALVELIPNGPNKKAFVGRIKPREFSAAHRKWSLEPFIQWDDLCDPQNHYNDGDKIYIEVTVKADAVYENDENLLVNNEVLTADETCSLKMRLTFNKIAKILGAVSDEFFISGIPFRVEVFNNTFDYDKKNNSLSVFLWRSDFSEEIIQLKAKFRLIAFQPESDDQARIAEEYVRNTGTAEFTRKVPRFGFSHFVPWNQLLEKYITEAGSIVMEIELVEIKQESSTPQTTMAFPNFGISSIACSCCFDTKETTTLLRINCGHLYCDRCIEADLNQRKQCLRCEEYVDNSTPPQPVLF